MTFLHINNVCKYRIQRGVEKRLTGPHAVYCCHHKNPRCRLFPRRHQSTLRRVVAGAAGRFSRSASLSFPMAKRCVAARGVHHRPRMGVVHRWVCGLASPWTGDRQGSFVPAQIWGSTRGGCPKLVASARRAMVAALLLDGRGSLLRFVCHQLGIGEQWTRVDLGGFDALWWLPLVVDSSEVW